ncbi:Protein kinase-like (PK-like) [Glarea lozoyensis ATCC 20868]|uniref:Protein kinase-like (PK-like) n=1 Tax=Glarea lozoyensis (strain ATCC 20868 / MF5171) TaxID=1116229 RepID=S3CU98_GLAL2|nr:Protein kinase-like (PK-like) [Glarea lozoyensis ATCC 20868]EPE29987.1 Protein kinase-like (PK-like) [Glarea lozoyensis ATCC 20868]
MATSARARPPGHDAPAIHEYLQWIANPNNCQEGMIDPASEEKHLFLPSADVERHLTAHNYRNLAPLLQAVFLNSHNNPIDACDMVEGYHCIFSILLQIGKGHLLGQFLHHDHLKDAFLPFSNDHPPADFPIDPADADPKAFLQRFCQQQMKFCPPKIENRPGKVFADGRILPFTVKERLAKGGSATLYKVVLHNQYDGLSTHHKTQAENYYVLKTYYGKNARTYYDREVNAFKKLRKLRNGSLSVSPNIIQFYGSFQHGDRYNILLEYADQKTLEHFFETIREPTTGGEIIAFWTSILKLVEGLYEIHQGCEDTSLDRASPLSGWHQDIKPANILITSRGEEGLRLNSPYEWHFKLADLGISHFTTYGDSTGTPRAIDFQGTRTYGAPECCRTSEFLRGVDVDITQSSDVWSLAAVLSEAAIWAVGGKSYLEEYRLSRKEATRDIHGLEDSDCFHDGQNLLPVVNEWHQKARDGVRKQDTTTDGVITVLEDMLVTDYRSTIAQVYKKFDRILGKAQNDLKRQQSLSPDPQTPKKTLPPVLPSPSPHNTSPSLMGDFSGGKNHQIPDPNYQAFGMYNNNVPIMSQPTLQIGQDNLPRTPTGKEPEQWLDRQIYNSPKPTLRNSDPETYQLGQPYSKPGPPMGRNSFVSAHHPNEMLPNGNNGYHPKSPQFMGGREPMGRFSPDRQQFIPEDRPQSGVSQLHMNHLHISSQEQNPDESFNQRVNEDQIGRLHNPLQQSGIYTAPLERSFQSRDITRRDTERHSRPPTQPQRTSTSPNDFPALNSSFASMAHRNTPQYDNLHSDERQTYPHAQPPGPPPTAVLERVRQRTRRKRTIPNKARANCSISTAIDWRDSKKSLFKRDIPLPGSWLLQELKERDHVFILDDTWTMRKQWSNLTPVFGALAYMVKTVDPDGLDLHFTMSNRLFHGTQTSVLVNQVRGHQCQGSSNMGHRLTTIMATYKAQLRDQYNFRQGHLDDATKEYVRPVNYYIFTDGRWDPGCEPDSAIKELTELMVELDVEENQVGIQFISFGNDKAGLANLKRLDDDLDVEIDVVDTTPSTGNAWKMLLGAIDRGYDETENSAQGASSSRR